MRKLLSLPWAACFSLCIVGHLNALEDLDDKPPPQSDRSVGADVKQRPVNWIDPTLARVKAALNRSPAAEERSIGGSLSIPRWGFGENIEKPTHDESSRSLSADPTDAMTGWPACAKKHVQPSQLTHAGGAAYSDDYDFGCIYINVSGDRNFDPNMRMALPDAGHMQAKPDCIVTDGRSIVPAENEPANSKDDTQGSFELQINIGNVPYSISGTCTTSEADPFCANKAAQCALVERLIYMGGGQ